MASYTPPFNITNRMLTLVSSISEKVGKISVTSNMQAKPHLRKNNRIKSIHSSLKIEANSLTIGQVRDVINGKTVLGEQKEIQEVKNAYATYEKLLEINPFNIDELKSLHGIMTKYLVDESGEFRKGEEGVFSGDKCIFMAPPAAMQHSPSPLRSLSPSLNLNPNPRLFPTPRFPAAVAEMILGSSRRFPSSTRSPVLMTITSSSLQL